MIPVTHQMREGRRERPLRVQEDCSDKESEGKFHLQRVEAKNRMRSGASGRGVAPRSLSLCEGAQTTAAGTTNGGDATCFNDKFGKARASLKRQQTCSTSQKQNDLEVQTLWSSLVLAIQHPLLCLLKVLSDDTHTTFTEGKQTRFRAYSLDISTRKVVLAHDEFLKVNVIRQRHLCRVNVKDAALGLDIRQRELNLPVDSTGADKRGVERLDAVSGHDDLDVAAGIKAVELVEQFQHCSLNLLFTARLGVVALAADSVDFINEYNRRRILLCYTEKLAHKFWPVTKVLLDQFTSHDTEESGRRLVGNGLGQKGFSSARLLK